MPVQFSLSPVQSAPSPCKSLHAADFIATDVPSTLCTLATYVRYGILRVPSCDCVKYCTIDVNYFDVLICTTHDDAKCPLLTMRRGFFPAKWSQITMKRHALWAGFPIFLLIPTYFVTRVFNNSYGQSPGQLVLHYQMHPFVMFKLVSLISNPKPYL